MSSSSSISFPPPLTLSCLPRSLPHSTFLYQFVTSQKTTSTAVLARWCLTFDLCWRTAIATMARITSYQNGVNVWSKSSSKRFRYSLSTSSSMSLHPHPPPPTPPHIVRVASDQLASASDQVASASDQVASSSDQVASASDQVASAAVFPFP